MTPMPIPPAIPTRQINTDDDWALIHAAQMNPDEWRALEYERIGYRPDLMADLAWRARHDTPPPRPEVPPQPAMRDLPQRCQVLALAQEMEAAGMSVTLRREFDHPTPGGPR